MPAFRAKGVSILDVKIRLYQSHRERLKYMGLFVASLILTLWTLHLLWLLTSQPSGLRAIFHILLQTFLFTGLFITAHDAMHGSVFPQNRKINHAIGALCSFLYGGFRYQNLLQSHSSHHAHPATNKDPDYTKGKDERFHIWFITFASRYFGRRELLMMNIHVGLCLFISHSFIATLFFFALPSWLSAIQLFLFGTYLPHRQAETTNSIHATRSNEFPLWLSFLTCFHFGYHLEHHTEPSAPWWRLPLVRRSLKEMKQNYAN